MNKYNQILITDPLSIFKLNRRFDLIFKYIYIKYFHLRNKTEFFTKIYLEHIRAFNNFHEEFPSDGIPKESPQDFIKSFDNLIQSIKLKNFDSQLSLVPIDINGELLDAAHRVSICTYYNKPFTAIVEDLDEYYDYEFFLKRNLCKHIADFGALEYIYLNNSSYIIQLHASVNTCYDNTVEKILNRYGTIFYKKNIFLNFNGYINLKKFTYGNEENSWIGTGKNNFRGAKDHARQSYGSFPLRIYILNSSSQESVIEAKREIREFLKKGNFSIHSSDTHQEAIEMAQLFFNKNSIDMLCSRPYKISTEYIDVLIEKFKSTLTNNHYNVNDFCIGGSAPINIYGIRESNDLDYISDKNYDSLFNDKLISYHGDQNKFYPHTFTDIIYNPQYHFFYKGIKFISLKESCLLKSKRHEVPKDILDISKIYKKIFLTNIALFFSSLSKQIKRLLYQIV